MQKQGMAAAWYTQRRVHSTACRGALRGEQTCGRTACEHAASGQQASAIHCNLRAALQHRKCRHWQHGFPPHTSMYPSTQVDTGRDHEAGGRYATGASGTMMRSRQGPARAAVLPAGVCSAALHMALRSLASPRPWSLIRGCGLDVLPP